MASGTRVALITSSYWKDFERCRLLCESIDTFVEGEPDHYILVADSDFSKFASLAGSRRFIINEKDILPSWLHNFQLGWQQNARRIWWSTRTWPMSGWHVQQLRRLAIAQHITHEGLLYCDSDMLFVKSFSIASLWRDGDLRLYRKDKGINSGLSEGGVLHMDWTRSAAKLNALDAPSFPAHDYINNLVSWRRNHVLEMCAHIEKTSGKNWVAAVGSNRSFSECQIYGAYADDFRKSEGHWIADFGLCKTYWSGKALDASGISQFRDEMDDRQVAIGIQSFTGTSTELLKALIPR